MTRSGARHRSATAAVAIAARRHRRWSCGGCSSDSTTTASIDASTPPTSPTASTSRDDRRPPRPPDTTGSTVAPTSTTAPPTSAAPTTATTAGTAPVRSPCSSCSTSAGRSCSPTPAARTSTRTPAPYAYAESVAAGVDMLDFDVQLTADGVLVVQHDDNDRSHHERRPATSPRSTYDAAGRARQRLLVHGCVHVHATSRRTRTSTAASAPVTSPPPAGYTPDDFIIPRFRDIAERFPDLPVNIEIKGDRRGRHRRRPAAGGRTDRARPARQRRRRLVRRHGRRRLPRVRADGRGHAGPRTSRRRSILDGTPLPDGMRILQLPVDVRRHRGAVTRRSIGADTRRRLRRSGCGPTTTRCENAGGYATAARRWAWTDSTSTSRASVCEAVEDVRRRLTTLLRPDFGPASTSTDASLGDGAGAVDRHRHPLAAATMACAPRAARDARGRARRARRAARRRRWMRPGTSSTRPSRRDPASPSAADRHVFGAHEQQDVGARPS